MQIPREVDRLLRRRSTSLAGDAYDLAGVFLGVINYVAVYALLKVLALEGWESSQLYPIYSVGVVAVSALLAVLFFKERLSRQKRFGLAVGLVAVALLNR